MKPWFAAVAALAVLAAPGSASAAMSCSASAVRVDLLGQHFEPVVANPASTPCVEASAGGAGTPSPGSALVTSALAGTYPGTGHNAAPGAKAFAYVANAQIPYTSYLSVSGMQSSAVGTCRDGAPAFGGTANVERIYSEADGKQPELPDEGVPSTIPLPGLGTLVVNEKIQTATSMTRRALRLDTPFFDVVLAESSVAIDSCPVRPSARALRRAGRMR